MKKFAAVSIAGVCLSAGTLMMAPPASAGDLPELTRTEILASLPKVSDVPKDLWIDGKRPTRKVGYKTTDPLGPQLCVGKDGKDIYGPQPKVSSASDMITLHDGGATTNTSAIETQVYNYGTAAKAAKAWKATVKLAKRCNRTLELTRPIDSFDIAHVVEKSTSRKSSKLFGTPGLIMTESATIAVTFDAMDLHIKANEYSAYRLVGPTIEWVAYLRLSFDQSSVAISKKRKEFVRETTDQTAQRLHKRWLS